MQLMDNYEGRYFAFQLNMVGQTPIIFSAQSEAERKEWMDHLVCYFSQFYSLLF
jgi:hypothetical protein